MKIYLRFLVLLIIIVMSFLYYSKHNNKYEIIRKLTRQCSRWLIASEQDESPLIATLHVQYGMGYLWAIKDISTTKEFYEATGIKFLTFEKQAVQIQDTITKKIVKVCPQFSGDVNTYLARIAGQI